MVETRCPHCHRTFPVSVTELAWRAARRVGAVCAVCFMLYTTGSLPASPPRFVDVGPVVTDVRTLSPGPFIVAGVVPPG